MAREKILGKLDSLFKEEMWGRIEPKDIGISKFKILDDLFISIVSEGLIQETIDACKSNLADRQDSITSMYLVGLIGYHNDNIEDAKQLRRLLDIFVDSHKWAIVEIIAEKVLEYGENSNALRAFALSLERLGRSKEAIPVLESLMKIDRFDADVAKKLAFAIVDEDQDKSIYYMKLSIEGFIKNQQYDEIAVLWNKLVSVSWEDIAFFERIERLLVESKQHDLAASLLKTLLMKYKDDENPDQSIEIIKKILDYKPEDLQTRKELVRLYKLKYGNHSQFEQFMKLSRINNFKAPVKYAIQDFEKNIVFDKGNYAYHITWKLGKIEDIDSESIIINFPNKQMHKMSIKMALQSLMPINRDHIYVQEYEDAEAVRSLFEDDFMTFFEILIKSFGGSMVLSDIRKELIPKYVEEKNWSKWWSRARTMIKKDPRFGFSDKKKDLVVMRDKPVTFADELLDNFNKPGSFSVKLDLAIEFINNIEPDEGSNLVQYLIDYFSDQLKGDSTTKQILSYFILTGMIKFVDAKKLKLEPIRSKVITVIRESAELPIISMKISSYDYKKELVNLIQEAREDWPHILLELLFETPLRIHRYIINILMQTHQYTVINTFINRVISAGKQFPEIYIWVARNLFSRTWDYDWLDYSRDSLTIGFFRLMNELKKIEIEGNRLKNMTMDVLFGGDGEILKNIVRETGTPLLGKIYDLLNHVSFAEDSHKERFKAAIKSVHPDYQLDQAQRVEESDAVFSEKLIVSKEGYDKMKAELERLANVELVALTKELAIVSDPSGDLRENVEYNALMEKQQTLELSIQKLDEELKRADVLDRQKISTDFVGIGTTVEVRETETGSIKAYTILGPWDADFEQSILSYRSPIAKTLMGKKAGEEVSLKVDDEQKKLMVVSIHRYGE
ncbi:MAG: transcription elongation factor GreA [Spirochaetes bacterium]|nr:transcription elongation factor GreA [Spirochaetota bacterium]